MVYLTLLEFEVQVGGVGEVRISKITKEGKSSSNLGHTIISNLL